MKEDTFKQTLLIDIFFTSCILMIGELFVEFISQAQNIT